MENSKSKNGEVKDLGDLEEPPFLVCNHERSISMDKKRRWNSFVDFQIHYIMQSSCSAFSTTKSRIEVNMYQENAQSYPCRDIQNLGKVIL